MINLLRVSKYLSYLYFFNRNNKIKNTVIQNIKIKNGNMMYIGFYSKYDIPMINCFTNTQILFETTGDLVFCVCFEYNDKIYLLITNDCGRGHIWYAVESLADMWLRHNCPPNKLVEIMKNSYYWFINMFLYKKIKPFSLIDISKKNDLSINIQENYLKILKRHIYELL